MLWGLLGVQAARLVMVVLTPVGPLGAPPKRLEPPRVQADRTIFARFDPFNHDAAPGGVVVGASDEVPGGLTLSGVRTDGRGGGSAILRAGDGREASFAVGEKIFDGSVLRRIELDHVLLSQGGRQVRIDFPSPGAGTLESGVPAAPAATGLPAGGPASQPAGTVGAAEFLAGAALMPNLQDGRPAGYRIMARGGGDVLARAGLQPGDVLLSLDGSELNAERVSQLPQELASAGEVELTFSRAGKTMTTRLRISSR